MRSFLQSSNVGRRAPQLDYLGCFKDHSGDRRLLPYKYNNLAATLEKRGMPREAEALYLDAIAICKVGLPHTRITN